MVFSPLRWLIAASRGEDLAARPLFINDRRCASAAIFVLNSPSRLRYIALLGAAGDDDGAGLETRQLHDRRKTR